MSTLKDPQLLETTGLDGHGPIIKEDAIYTDVQIADLLLKDSTKPHCRLQRIQKLFRNKEIKGRKVGRGWTAYGRAVRDYLLCK